MKTYQEYKSSANTITESNDEVKQYKEINKGREGKTLLGMDGKEIKDSIYLGDGYSASKRGSAIVVSPAQEDALRKSQYISIKHFDLLKKAF